MKDNIRILSTASLNERLVQLLADNNLQADTASFIRIITPVNPALRARVEAIHASPATVIFTSANAVHPVGQLLQDKTGLKVYCIGGATRDAVTEYFGAASIAAIGDNASDLVKKITIARPGKVIFFCGNERMDTIPQRLSANNIEVEEIEVYQTRSTPEKMPGEYDGILFFSPSGVKSFFSVNKVSEHAVCFAIGSTTAAEIGVYTKNKIIIAGQPGKREVIESVIKYYNGNH